LTPFTFSLTEINKRLEDDFVTEAEERNQTREKEGRKG